MLGANPHDPSHLPERAARRRQGVRGQHAPWLAGEGVNEHGLGKKVDGLGRPRWFRWSRGDAPRSIVQADALGKLAHCYMRDGARGKEQTDCGACHGWLWQA